MIQTLFIEVALTSGLGQKMTHREGSLDQAKDTESKMEGDSD